MRLRWTLGVLALAAVGCTAPPPPNGPEQMLAEMTSRTRFAHVQPDVTLTITEDGWSWAQCPGKILIGIPSEASAYRWTLAHEWGHVMACDMGMVPSAFPRTQKPVPWKYDGISTWDIENWADCVAEYLTGYDGGPAREYPPCTDAQDRWTAEFLQINP